MQTKTITQPLSQLKAPDGAGEFGSEIAQTFPEDTPAQNADADKEIFGIGFADEQDGEIVPLLYQHAQGDPYGAIGGVLLRPLDSRSVLPARGKLLLEKTIAQGVYERMLLPATDRRALREFSVGFEFDPADTFTRPDGVKIIRKARVLEVSVVYRGAQTTRLVSIKNGTRTPHLDAAQAALRSQDYASFARDEKARRERADMVALVGRPGIVEAKQMVRAVVEDRPATSPAARRDAEKLISTARARIRRGKEAAVRFDSYSASRLGRDPDRLVLGRDMRPIIDESATREREVVIHHLGESVRGGAIIERATAPEVRPETFRIPALSAETPLAQEQGRNAELRYSVTDDGGEPEAETFRRVRVR